jgi:hypothetical protein
MARFIKGAQCILLREAGQTSIAESGEANSLHFAALKMKVMSILCGDGTV